MARRQRAAQVRPDQSFKGRQFTAEVILWAVRWYLMFPVSYRDLELMLADRSVNVDHTTIYRRIQAYAPEIDKRIPAKRFFRKALGQPHTVNPRTITVDKNPAYPCAVAEMKEDGELWRFARLRHCKFLNNVVEQDHRRVKRLVRPGLGFGDFHTARRTLAGYEAMAMVRKGQVRGIGGRDMRAQASFIAELFQVAA